MRPTNYFLINTIGSTKIKRNKKNKQIINKNNI